jgi:hypothetical protein
VCVCVRVCVCVEQAEYRAHETAFFPVFEFIEVTDLFVISVVRGGFQRILCG